MSDGAMFDRHRITEVGLSIEFFQSWPTESIADADGRNTYQRVADTGGLVFLRYGKRETIDAFLQMLSDVITTVSVVRDEQITYGGHPARHMTLLQHRQGIGVYRRQAERGLVHGHSPEARTVISVIGFDHRGVPVLVGYRIPEPAFNTYRAILEQIIDSVEFL